MERPKGGGPTLPVRSLVLLFAFGLLESVLGQANKTWCYDSRRGQTVHDFSLMDIHGQKNVSLKQHMGKVLLIVNVASF
jgi:hypothetical protein